MLINKRGHYCEFIYINTTVAVILLSLRKTRLIRIIKVHGVRVCCGVDTPYVAAPPELIRAQYIIIYYMRAYILRTRDCLP